MSTVTIITKKLQLSTLATKSSVPIVTTAAATAAIPNHFSFFYPHLQLPLFPSLKNVRLIYCLIIALFQQQPQKHLHWKVQRIPLLKGYCESTCGPTPSDMQIQTNRKKCLSNLRNINYSTTTNLWSLKMNKETKKKSTKKKIIVVTLSLLLLQNSCTQRCKSWRRLFLAGFVVSCS